MNHRLKIIVSVAFSLTTIQTFAISNNSLTKLDYSDFQAFDNQFYIGYGANYGNLVNNYGQNSNYGTNFIGLGIERLFDIGLWARLDGTLMTAYSNFNSSNPNATTGPLGQSPSIGDMNAKIGYAFQIIPRTLLLTPYLLFGRNTNLTANSINNNQSSSQSGTMNTDVNVTEDYFLTGGVGGRLEYRINQVIELYLDQNALYNSDQAGTNNNYSSASNYQLSSSLGAKFNVWDDLQLGLNGFYVYNQLSAAPTASQSYQLYLQNQLGGLVTVGLTY